MTYNVFGGTLNLTLLNQSVPVNKGKAVFPFAVLCLDSC